MLNPRSKRHRDLPKLATRSPVDDQVPAGLDSDGRARGAGCFDVLGDLRDELRFRLESPFVPEAQPQLDDEPLAVEVALEVEQVRLDPPLFPAVVRIDA